jgi:hypothetical protein
MTADTTASLTKRRGAAAVAVGVASAAVAVAAVFGMTACSGGGARSVDFGDFAGYVWYGHVTAVHAGWRVPRAAPLTTGTAGIASTWLGAGAGRADFVQAGTFEVGSRSAPRGSTQDVAFWSDTAHRGAPVSLFALRAGDRLSISLVVRSQRWWLVVTDATSRERKSVAGRFRTRTLFSEADWIQEDPPEPSGRAAPYAHVGAVAFTDVSVNHLTPTPSRLYSRWLSVEAVTYGPSAFTDHGFDIGRRDLGRSGRAYLALLGASARSYGELFAVIRGARAEATRAVLRRACRHTLAAAARVANGLRHRRWPASAQRSVDALIKALEDRRDGMCPQTDSAESALWRQSALGYLARIAFWDHTLRRALGVPDLTR